MDESLPVQSPVEVIFSADALEWNHEKVAHIPHDRLEDFIVGEGKGVPKLETNYFLRRSEYNPGIYAKWHSKVTYWCAFGPDDHGSVKPKEPPIKGTYPPRGIGVGSRPYARKHDYNGHQKQGCQAHFTVTRFKVNPNIAAIKLVNSYIFASLECLCVLFKHLCLIVVFMQICSGKNSLVFTHTFLVFIFICNGNYT